MRNYRWVLTSTFLILAVGYLKRTPGMLAGVGIIAAVWGIAWLFRTYVRPINRK
jgi:hypothetical protein